jgi:hypothetical protein
MSYKLPPNISTKHLKVMFFQQSMYQLYFEALATKEILEQFALEKESLDKKQRNGIEGHVFSTIYVTIIL